MEINNIAMAENAVFNTDSFSCTIADNLFYLSTGNGYSLQFYYSNIVSKMPDWGFSCDSLQCDLDYRPYKLLFKRAMQFYFPSQQF